MTLKKWIQSLQATAHRGNSLTFLVMSLLVISTSLAATTMALGPGLESMVAGHPIQEFMEQVAQSHLAQIESGVMANPDLLAQSNWSGSFSGADGNTGVNLPQYTILDPTAFTSYTAPSDTSTPARIVATYTPAAMRVNNNTTDLNITSTLSQPDFRRLTASPYDNMLYVKVRVTAGGKTLWRGKFITVSHQSCFRGVDTTASSNPIPFETNEVTPDPNFNISNISGPFMQVGNERICNLPDNTSADLQCPVTVMGSKNFIRLLHGSRDVFEAGKSATNIFYLWRDNNPSTGFGRYRLHLKTTFVTNGVPTNLDENSELFPSGVNENTPFYVHVFPPSVADGTRHYKAVIVFLDPNDDQVKLSYARWTTGGISTSPQEGGIFRTTANGGPDYTNPFDDDSTSDWSNDPDDPSFTIDSLTYHEATRQIVVANNDKGRIYVRKLGYFNYVDTNSDNVDDILKPDNYVGGLAGIVASSDPNTMASSNPGKVLDGNVDFKELWVSQDGQTIVAKVEADISGDRLHVVAFKPGTLISSINSSLSLSGDPTQNTNIASIMAFDNLLAPTDTNGQLVTNDDALRLWYNSYTNKFYWVVHNAGASSNFLYEWDPDAWGNLGFTASGASQWVETPGSDWIIRTRKRVIGQMAGAAGGLYTGTFRTVRKIHGQPGINTANQGFSTMFTTPQNAALWTGTDGAGNPAALQITYNPTTETYYIVDDTALREINLRKGYRSSFHLPASGVSNRGRKLLVHPKTGWLYYVSIGATSADQGVYAYNPLNQDHGRAIAGINFNLISPTDMLRGNGDLIYNPYTQQVYVLRFPAAGVIDSANRPQFVRYTPYCMTQQPNTPVQPMSLTALQQLTPVAPNSWYQVSDGWDDASISDPERRYQWSEYRWSKAN